MTDLEWTEDDMSATAEQGEWSIWIEKLDLENAGRFVWTVDTSVLNYPNELLIVDCGVEFSLSAAKNASCQALTHFVSMGIG